MSKRELLRRLLAGDITPDQFREQLRAINGPLVAQIDGAGWHYYDRSARQFRHVSDTELQRLIPQYDGVLLADIRLADGQ